MGNRVRLSYHEFIKLASAEVRQLVREAGKPRAGVFIADGNRRYIMTQRKSLLMDEAFCHDYARYFVQSFRESLDIFFEFGLETLFFPLFGPSLLERRGLFQEITIPEVYRGLFVSEDIFGFYRERNIRICHYGDLAFLDAIDVKKMGYREGVQQASLKTADHTGPSVCFGFMSDNTPGFEMPERIIHFYRQHGRAPAREEIIREYYGTNLPDADFIIFSGKLSGHGALPPFIATQKAKAYYFPVPGFLGLTRAAYLKILYDLLYQRNIMCSSVPDDILDHDKIIQWCAGFYDSHKNRIIGIDDAPGERKL